ncbi:hypothetical protein XELAEV_18041368mg [Xenopus laevis]|uniref:Secreted protein n=1 Tax=Xenopus laevis TaxID=8355 RepID=A0A974C1Y8_XENLA|nr:hypothetical protein XELAEV_18041368mg [Xenopus laevis]
MFCFGLFFFVCFPVTIWRLPSKCGRYHLSPWGLQGILSHPHKRPAKGFPFPPFLPPSSDAGTGIPSLPQLRAGMGFPLPAVTSATCTDNFT